jgi:hypothetical protein
VYFLVPVEDFNLDKINEIKKEIFTHLLKLVYEHNEFKKNALAGNDLSELTKGFIKLSEEILKSKTIFPKKDTKIEKSTNVEPKSSEFIRSDEATRQIVREEITQYMTSIQKRSILTFSIIIAVGFMGAIAFWVIKNGNFRQNNPQPSTTPVTSEHQSYLVRSKYLTRNFVN